MSKCYYCGEKAITKEHCPPKCFFPQKSNLQLKTVPSCEEHNNRKSNDDQYLLAHICMNAAKQHNLAEKIFIEKILPELQKFPGFKYLFSNQSISNNDSSTSYVVDIARFDIFFNLLTGAIYYNHFKNQFNSHTHIMQHIYLNLKYTDPIQETRQKIAESMIKNFIESFQQRIQHVEADKIDEIIYAYDIISPAGISGSITVLHTFYGVFNTVSLLTAQHTP